MVDICLITSVINTGTNPWSYTNIRSVFSMEERFQQSLTTICSIREKMPADTRIYFAECSDIPEHMEQALKDACDMFFQFKDNENVRSACLNSQKKGYGELLKTKKVMDQLLTDNIPFRRFFKISGRYFVNDSFREEMFSHEAFTFRQPFPNSTCNPTVLYSVPYCKREEFMKGLCQSEHEFQTVSTLMYEISMPSKMIPMHCIDCCGVSGYVAIDGTLYEDKRI